MAAEAEARERFNFGNAGQLAADQTRTLRLMADQFSRNLSHILSAWLRVQLHVNTEQQEQTTYDGFLERCTQLTYLVPLRIEPLELRGVLMVDKQLVAPLVECLLGGGAAGAPQPATHEVTEIEESILTGVFEMVTREWNTLWRSLAVEFVLGSATQEGEQRLMVATERVFCPWFQMTLLGVSGRFGFCLPAAAISTVLRAAGSRRRQTRSRRAGEREALETALAEMHVPVHMRLPSVRVTAQQLAELRPGTLLRLQIPQAARSNLVLRELPVFTAAPVRRVDRRAAQIDQLFTLGAGETTAVRTATMAEGEQG